MTATTAADPSRLSPRRRDWGSCPPLLLAPVAGGLFLLAAAVFAVPEATYEAKSVWDNVLHLDAMHRLRLGQSPHVDFHTPIGTFAYALHYLGYLATGRFGGAPEFASVLMLAILAPLAVVALAGRAPTIAGLPILVAVFAVVVVPVDVGETSGFAVSQGRFYNRWGWGALTVLLLFGLPRPTGEAPARGWLDAATVALLLGLLFFTKITHFVAGLAFVAVVGIALGRFRRAGGLGLAGFLVCAACVAALWATTGRGSLVHYIGDIARVAAVAMDAGAPTPDPMPSFLETFFAVFGQITLAAMACGVVALARPPRLREMALAACIVVVSVGVLAEDSSVPGTLFGLAALFVHLVAACRRRSAHQRLIVLGMWLWLLPLFGRQLTATAAFGLATSSAFGHFETELPGMGGVRVGGPGITNNAFEALAEANTSEAIRWARHHPPHTFIDLSAAEYLYTLRHGLALLDAAGASQDRVTTADFGNAFSALTGGPPPKGVLFCLHVGRQMNRRIAADRELMFGDAQWLMVPKFPVKQATTELLLEVHSAHLASAWETVAENDYWRLLRKVPPNSDSKGSAKAATAPGHRAFPEEPRRRRPASG